MVGVVDSGVVVTVVDNSGGDHRRTCFVCREISSVMVDFVSFVENGFGQVTNHIGRGGRECGHLQEAIHYTLKRDRENNWRFLTLIGTPLF